MGCGERVGCHERGISSGNLTTNACILFILPTPKKESRVCLCHRINFLYIYIYILAALHLTNPSHGCLTVFNHTKIILTYICVCTSLHTSIHLYITHMLISALTPLHRKLPTNRLFFQLLACSSKQQSKHQNHGLLVQRAYNADFWWFFVFTLDELFEKNGITPHVA